MRDDAQLGCYRLLVDKNGDLVVEVSTVPEDSLNDLKLSDNDKLLLKAAIRVFNRQRDDLHKKVEYELATVVST